MTPTYTINGRPGSRISIAERALHYGDGVFETLRVRASEAEFLPRHMTRLAAGCERLKFPALDWDTVRRELVDSAARCEDAVIKIILGRSGAGRGYGPVGDQSVTRITGVYPLPQWPTNPDANGIRARLCRTRLALQPLLAGIKHLNRLEQVLARAEWDEAAIAEGLLFDRQERLIEGTMSNIFVLNGDVLMTPDLSDCGVAGIMRSVILDLCGALGIEVSIQHLKLEDLKRAGEIFVCNSLIGIWPLVSIDALGEFDIGPVSRRLQTALKNYKDTDESNWYPS